MKKIIFLMLLMFSLNVKAEENLTLYTKYSDYIDGYKEGSDLIELVSEYKYKYYNKSIIMGDYYIYGENPNEYPLIQEDDIIFTDISERSLIRPEEKPNRGIITEDVYYYKDMKEIRYIHLYNTFGPYNAFRVSEVEVYAGDYKIDFKLTCTLCSIEFEELARDQTIYYRNDSLIINGGYLVLDLENYYPADSIKFVTYLYDPLGTAQNYSVAFTREPSREKKYLDISMTTSFKSTAFNHTLKREFSAVNMNVSDPEYYEEKESYTPVYSSKTRIVDFKRWYSYEDVLYRYYNEVLNYSKDYLSGSSEEYPYISNIGEIFYKYRYRDKIILKSPIIIENLETKIEDFVLFSSSDYTYEIDDYSSNGIYNLRINLNDEFFDLEVVYNIASPLKKGMPQVIKEKVETIKENNQIRKKTKKVEKTNKDINKMIALPLSLIFLIPTYFYFKTEYNKQ